MMNFPALWRMYSAIFLPALAQGPCHTGGGHLCWELLIESP